MLYKAYQLRNDIFAPFAAFLKEQIPNIEGMIKDQLTGRFITGLIDIFERSNRVIQKPSFGIKEVTNSKGETFSISEEILAERPFCNLLHFKKSTPQNEPKVLIVAPMSGHYASLLRDTERTMLKDHDVYLTDWKNARDVPLSEGFFNLDEYTSYLIDFIKIIGKNVNIVGVCQPVVQVMAATAYLNNHHDEFTPKTVTIMGGPLDPRANKTEVNRLAERYSADLFKQNMLYRVPARYKGAGRLVYPGVLQLTAFMMMNPDKHFMAFVKYHIDYIKNNKEAMKKHTDFYDEYLTVMDMDAPWFMETIEKVFQTYDFPQDTLTYKNEIVSSNQITRTALMTIEGEKDDISAPGQTYAAHNLCKNLPENMKESYLQKGVGHYGIFSGSKWRAEVYPRLKNFIYKHNNMQ